MLSVTVNCHIQATPEAVFQAFTDLENAPKRIPTIKSIEILSGPAQMAKGTRWRETRVMFGKEASETMEITGFDPPRSYSAEANSHGCLYRTSFRFTPEGGGTRVESTFTSTPQSFGAKVVGGMMGWVMKKMIRKCFDADLRHLKEHLERQGSPAGASTSPAVLA